MTLDSAYLMNQEDEVGSSEAGKRADMIVLDNDLFDIPATQIGSARVQLTIFDGRVVYDVTRDATGEEAIEEEYGVELDLGGGRDVAFFRAARRPETQDRVAVDARAPRAG